MYIYTNFVSCICMSDYTFSKKTSDTVRSGSKVIPIKELIKRKQLLTTLINKAEYGSTHAAITPQKRDEKTKITVANEYDEELSENKKIPTAKEFIENKIFYTEYENDQIYKTHEFKKARRLANFHEALYLGNIFIPFFKYPFKSFDHK